MIYALKQHGHIKIGFASCMWQRIGGLRSEYGTDFTLIALWHGDRFDEQEMHDILSERRVKHGSSREWYALAPEEEAAVRRKCAAVIYVEFFGLAPGESFADHVPKVRNLSI